MEEFNKGNQRLLLEQKKRNTDQSGKQPGIDFIRQAGTAANHLIDEKSSLSTFPWMSNESGESLTDYHDDKNKILQELSDTLKARKKRKYKGLSENNVHLIIDRCPDENPAHMVILSNTLEKTDKCVRVNFHDGKDEEKEFIVNAFHSTGNNNGKWLTKETIARWEHGLSASGWQVIFNDKPSMPLDKLTIELRDHSSQLINYKRDKPCPQLLTVTKGDTHAYVFLYDQYGEVPEICEGLNRLDGGDAKDHHIRKLKRGEDTMGWKVIYNFKPQEPVTWELDMPIYRVDEEPSISGSQQMEKTGVAQTREEVQQFLAPSVEQTEKVVEQPEKGEEQPEEGDFNSIEDFFNQAYFAD